MVDYMDVDMVFLHRILKNATRRRIILQLYEKGSLTYVDLMSALGITNTGKFNYHLKVLGDLVKKEDGKYCLSEKGMLASQFVLGVPAERPTEIKRIRIGDVMLIGFIGFVLILLNPAILEHFLGALLVKETWFSIIASIYTFIVPGALVWSLSVKRMKTHELPHLVKPALLSLIFLVGFVVLLFFLWLLSLLFGFKFPYVAAIPYSQLIEPPHQMDGGQVVVTVTKYRLLPIWGLTVFGVYSLFGIILLEAIYRIFRHFATRKVQT
jgi:hypothetical protein